MSNILFKKIFYTKWTSGNEKIDIFIQETQLKINHYEDIIFEQIPYSQFNDILNKQVNMIQYSAIQKNGPLCMIYMQIKSENYFSILDLWANKS